METEDLYEILHLHPSAHPDVIVAAYRRLALLYHPDKNPSSESTEVMAAVNRAYAILSDPVQREEYDRQRAASVSSRGGDIPSAASASKAWQPSSNEPRSATDYFTLGSTMDEVARVQRIPPEITETPDGQMWVWEHDYLISAIFFSSGRVTGWMDMGYLRVFIVPGPNVTSKDYFTVGDHPDDVVRLQGTPHSIVDAAWLFEGKCRVHFSDQTGLVSGWDNEGGTLKVCNGPIPGPGTRGGSTVGSPRGTIISHWRSLGDEPGFTGMGNRDANGFNYFLVVRFKKRKLDLFVTWNTEISYSQTTTVNYQIDNGPNWRQSWETTTDGRATFMPSHDVAETIRALFDATFFRVEVYPFGGNPLIAEFRVEGFEEAVGPILDAWRRAESPAPGVPTRGGGCLLPVSALSLVGFALGAMSLLLL